VWQKVNPLSSGSESRQEQEKEGEQRQEEPSKQEEEEEEKPSKQEEEGQESGKSQKKKVIFVKRKTLKKTPSPELP
jgi:hypothetical protein